MQDESNGYETVAAQYIAGRGARSGVGIGVREVREWIQTLPSGGAVLDLGCGPGFPITSLLVDAGLRVYGVDASPTMLAQLSARLPTVVVECNTAEGSGFFDRSFDGVLAWGLLFLLAPSAQQRIIEKVGRALVPGGHFLFTAPAEVCEWLDRMTHLRSESLGAETYERLLSAAGLELLQETEDEGRNHYYMSVKR